MIYQFDKYRNKKGYILLNTVDKEILDGFTGGSRKNKQWFLINNERYLFKGNNGPLEEIKEIINELIATQINILSAEYDIAIYDGAKGVITKDFSNNRNFKPMLSFLCEINNVKNDLYTYILVMQKKGLDEQIIRQNIKIWLHNHILDIFTCQRDRHFKNMALFNDDFTPTPRYDSSGSFLTISKHDKIYNFLKSESKKALIEKYRGTRTKLRIFPGSISENSLDELLKAQYVPNLANNTSQLLNDELLNIKSDIFNIFEIDFNEIYYQLKEANISLKPIYQDYFKIIIDCKIQEYLEKETQYRKLHL